MEQEILQFLKGNDEIIRNKILEKINYYSENLNYEMALELKNELEYIDIVLSKQKVELHDFIDRDIFSYYIDKGYISIEILFIRNGKLLNHKNEINILSIEEIDEVESYIVNFYNKHEVPKEILLPEGLNEMNVSSIIKSNRC